MFVTIFGRFETPHEAEMARGGLVNQGISTQDISLSREDNSLLIRSEKEKADDVMAMLEERGATNVNMREQPTMERGLDEKEAWQGNKKPLPAHEKAKMPHAGPLES